MPPETRQTWIIICFLPPKQEETRNGTVFQPPSHFQESICTELPQIICSMTDTDETETLPKTFADHKPILGSPKTKRKHSSWTFNNILGQDINKNEAKKDLKAYILRIIKIKMAIFMAAAPRPLQIPESLAQKGTSRHQDGRGIGPRLHPPI